MECEQHARCLTSDGEGCSSNKKHYHCRVVEEDLKLLLYTGSRLLLPGMVQNATIGFQEGGAHLLA